MGDWAPGTSLGVIGMTILFAIYAAGRLITYPYRLGRCVRRNYKYFKKWPPKYDRPKVI